MNDIALRQRIEARLDRPATVIQLRKPFDASVRQADLLGQYQIGFGGYVDTPNRYRYHGPVLRRLIRVFAGVDAHPYISLAGIFGAGLMANTARAWGLL